MAASDEVEIVPPTQVQVQGVDAEVDDVDGLWNDPESSNATKNAKKPCKI